MIRFVPAPRRSGPRVAAVALALVTLLGAAAAQAPDDGPIREMIARLDRGEADAVRKALPEYVAKYQNHPGVLYLQARVATDGIEAAKLYQSVIDNYPSSEWADDALFHIYQYYYAMGLYKTAELKMQQLRKEYPGSEFLAGKPAAAGTDSAAAPPPAARPGGAAAETTAARTTPPAPEPITPGRPDAPEGDRYALQVGAFSTSENALKQKTWFEDRGYTAEITNRVRSGRSLFLVWVGSFPDADGARKVLREIQAKYNITPIVVER